MKTTGTCPECKKQDQVFTDENEICDECVAKESPRK